MEIKLKIMKKVNIIKIDCGTLSINKTKKLLKRISFSSDIIKNQKWIPVKLK